MWPDSCTAVELIVNSTDKLHGMLSCIEAAVDAFFSHLVCGKLLDCTDLGCACFIPWPAFFSWLVCHAATMQLTGFAYQRCCWDPHPPISTLLPSINQMLMPILKVPWLRVEKQIKRTDDHCRSAVSCVVRLPVEEIHGTGCSTNLVSRGGELYLWHV